MTAFLIESYKNLSEDPTTTTNMLLQQISSQTNSYSIHDGFLNSTARSTTSPQPFEPSLAALRVNILWFASLIFSLATASFSMLVKQWLREYMAGEFTSPQARLRVRQFRHPALSHWKVFEIAAILPILLQLSLGLFFLGLCFFTWSVHPSIGRTTTPLVAGWAFLFFFANVAPIFSSRCPYKTTLLKDTMKSVRRLLCRIVWLRTLYIGPQHPRSKSLSKRINNPTRFQSTNLADFLFTHQDGSRDPPGYIQLGNVSGPPFGSNRFNTPDIAPITYDNPLQRPVYQSGPSYELQDAGNSEESSLLPDSLSRFPNPVIVNPPQPDVNRFVVAVTPMIEVMTPQVDQSTAGSGAIPCPVDVPTLDHTHAQDFQFIEPLEDEDVALDVSGDIRTFIAVDEIMMLDDNFLGTTMRESLQQSTETDMIKFVVKAAGNRLHKPEGLDLSSVPDMRSLSKPGWTSITDITADAVLRLLAELDRGSHGSDWAGLKDIKDALTILFARSDNPLTSNGNQALALCVSGDPGKIIRALLLAVHGLSHAAMLERLHHALVGLPIQDAMPALTSLFGELIVKPETSQPQHSELAGFVQVDSLPAGTLKATLDILVDCAARSLTARKGSPMWLEYALRAILSAPILPNGTTDVSKLLSRFLCEPGSVIFILTPVISSDPLRRARSLTSAEGNIGSAFLDSDLAGRGAILQNFAWLMDRLARDLTDPTTRHLISNTPDPVRMCHLATSMMKMTTKPVVVTLDLKNEWEGLFTAICKATKNYLNEFHSQQETEQREALVKECVEIFEAQVSSAPSDTHIGVAPGPGFSSQFLRNVINTLKNFDTPTRNSNLQGPPRPQRPQWGFNSAGPPMPPRFGGMPRGEPGSERGEFHQTTEDVMAMQSMQGGTSNGWY
ncbi:hypothetical protein PHLCEN_2v181 [Hermanssonia centrifuga]|uniref:DUF6535 domain-containing protein n=1 Tax=Hermanssonia centrifuga TaxID=98765 RepID=A0A2R6S6T4_9APHY|nr:hypothetical protein PHLCEN_2v181 [Hermanssonia centrifuga]